MTRELSILGAGGHAKVVIEAAMAAGWRVAGIYDDLATGSLLGHSIVGKLADAPMDVPALLAIGDNKARFDLATSGREWATIVHPTAWISPSTFLHAGAVVMAGAIIQADAIIGAHAIINTGAAVDHDCRIGEYAHLGPGVHLCGGVEVGEGALLGVGSSVIPKVSIGTWATIGAGAAVVCDIPDRVHAVGVPARWA